MNSEGAGRGRLRLGQDQVDSSYGRGGRRLEVTLELERVQAVLSMSSKCIFHYEIVL